MKKIQKAIAIGFVGGVVSIIALALLEAITNISLLHPAGGLTAIVALFLPSIITGYISTDLSGD
jgi:hypothetical protein